MSDETIVAIYDTPAHAELAASDLRQAGVPDSAINVHAGAATTATGTPTVAPREEGFWSSLFGGSPDHDTAVYDRSVASGSSVLTVQAPEQHITRVLEILESHNPIDIDDRAASYGLGHGSTAGTVGTTGAAAAAATGAVTGASTLPAHQATTGLSTEPGKIQLAEESLSVGKRLVNRGGTRIRRFVVERPVEENVSLRTERVVLERNPVTDGRPATDSFSDKTIEMTETSEEAVVAKSAHVYEEVGLRKEAAERVETVRDTVRKEEVEVEQLPVSETASTTNRPVPPTK